MWNILIVIIIAAVIWFFNPLLHNQILPKPGVDKKTVNEVNQKVLEVQQQVDFAKQMQNQPQD